MKSSAKQIQSSVSPNLRVRLSPSLTLKAFLRELRWSKLKNCYTTAIYTRAGGLSRFYIMIWSVLSQFKWPLLFLHHRGRGRGTRLSIRSQDPNNSSDTERGPCLVRSYWWLFRNLNYDPDSSPTVPKQFKTCRNNPSQTAEEWEMCRHNVPVEPGAPRHRRCAWVVAKCWKQVVYVYKTT